MVPKNYFEVLMLIAFSQSESKKVLKVWKTHLTHLAGNSFNSEIFNLCSQSVIPNFHKTTLD